MASTRWTFELDTQRSPAVLSLSGEIDMASRDDMISAALVALDSDGSALVIDATGVTFCDSVGLSGLIAMRRIAHAQGKQILLGAVSPHLGDLLRTTGTYDYLTGASAS